MARILLLFSLLLFISAAELYGQHNDELEYRKVRVTLVPGLSTNGLDAPNYTARYSFNLLVGYHGGLDGFEIGPVNINRYYARGVQIGGINATGGDMEGLQFAFLGNKARQLTGLQFTGGVNASENNTSGLQVAGIGNIAGNGLEGLLISGMGNVSGGSSEGLMISGGANFARTGIEGLLIAGIGNISGGRSEGLLITGGANIASESEGLMIAGILNTASNMKGLQISGGANISRDAEGLQIGLINYAETFRGMPVGLISYYGDGRKNLEFWSNETGFTHAGIKLGTRQIYNMISAGYNPFINDRDVWSVGWTIGDYSRLNESWSRDSLEGYFSSRSFSIQVIQDGGWSRRLNHHYSYRYFLGREFNGASLFAGPTINILFSRVEGNDEYVPYSIFKRTGGDRDIRAWIGFTAGVQIFNH